MARAILGLGGNLGDPRRAMGRALRHLGSLPGTRVDAASRLFRTPPWGLTDQPAFLNAVARIETAMSPHELLEACLAIERDLKRERTVRWGPRTLDLDIVDHDGVALVGPKLTLPHPRAAERAFVLVPWLDIDPDGSFAGRTLKALAAEGETDAIVAVSADGEWWRRS